MKYNSKDFPSLGFSLIEVLICLFIFSILIGLSSTSYLSLSPKYKLQKAVWEIRSRLNSARYQAIFEGEKVRVSFDPPRYKIEQFDEEQDLWMLKLENILEGAAIDANNNPLFHPGGTVSNLASIYVTNSWGQYKITIAITGRIKVTLI
jgi:prepilin-type N-terminal cleavage/methylation domain-containing protein